MKKGVDPVLVYCRLLGVEVSRITDTGILEG